MPLREEIIAEICNLVGWLAPYFLQVIFAEICSLVKKRPKDDSADIDSALLARAFSAATGSTSYFDHWHERLGPILGATKELYAKLLLNLCATDPAGATKQTMTAALGAHISTLAVKQTELRYLLGVLETDGYLVEMEARWRFRSPLIREYWIQRFAP